MMKKEFEKKFTVKNNKWKELVYKSEQYIQGYVSKCKNKFGCGIIRIRILNNKKAFLCIKWQDKNNFDRTEIEYNIPMRDAKFIIKKMCHENILQKTRYFIKYNENTDWEIDVFEENNSELIIAEIELKNENETIIKPEWIGIEVTHNSKYLNYNLAKTSLLR